jgi:hypothetical protein
MMPLWREGEGEGEGEDEREPERKRAQANNQGKLSSTTTDDERSPQPLLVSLTTMFGCLIAGRLVCVRWRSRWRSLRS